MHVPIITGINLTMLCCLYIVGNILREYLHTPFFLSKRMHEMWHPLVIILRTYIFFFNLLLFDLGIVSHEFSPTTEIYHVF
jgi:hypothetical protein